MAEGLVPVAQLLVRLESDFFDQLVGAGDTKIADARAAFQAAVKANEGDDALDHYAEEAGGAEDFARDVAEVTMVALYHWVERTLKRELAAASKKPASKFARLAYPALDTEFSTKGITLTALANGPLVTATLRLFANSWKHSPASVHPLLLADLGLTGEHVDGHFEDAAIRSALAAKLGSAQGSSPGEIVRLFVVKAREFLVELIPRSRAVAPS